MLKFVAVFIFGALLTQCCNASPPPSEYDYSYQYPVKQYTFKAVVDHFSFQPTFTPTFDLRYFVNDDNWSSDNGCVFFYAGNEADILQFVNNTGFMFEASKEFNALVVFAEHRYYGTSQIPWDDSFKYLTVEQAMADFNTLTLHLRRQWNMTENTAFVVFGGSYGGNLAMWLRLKNPNIWAGAIASSATPLKHLLRETNAFNLIETQVYANVSKECPNIVRQSWNELFRLIETTEGKKQIMNSLGLCSEPDDAQDIYYWISDALETMVQYGYPYPTDFYNPVPAFPFAVACKRMLSPSSATSALGKLREAVNVYYNYTGQAGHCYGVQEAIVTGAYQYLYRKGARDLLSRRRSNNEKRRPKRLRDSDKQPAGSSTKAAASRKLLAAGEGKTWGYQTCTEVYQPMPTDGVTDFEIPYTPNKEDYFEDCRQEFGVEPRPNWEELHFMGENIGAGSNIFLASGQLDPWRAAGIQTKPRGAPDSIIVRIIEDGAHHLDLRESNPLDPPSVTAVREEEREAMRGWIEEWKELHSY